MTLSIWFFTTLFLAVTLVTVVVKLWLKQIRNKKPKTDS
jgi:hypothetical protein